MAGRLDGKRIAFLAASGVEQVELTQPRQTLEAEGARTTLISVEDGPLQAMNADINKADTFDVDAQIDDVRADDFDGLVLPGGTCNPDTLRQNQAVLSFVREIDAAGKPIGAICHAPWTLVEADLVRGRTLTSFPSLRTDIRNAGGTAVDQEVVVDGHLVTSRNPNDLDAFCAAVVDQLAAVAAR